MRYKGIESQIGAALAPRLVAGEEIEFAKFEVELGAGAAYSDKNLESIAAQIRKIQARLIKDKASPEALDALAFSVVHAGLPHDPDLLGDYRFWMRFALVFLFDVVVWRFPGRKDAFNPENLGIGGSARKRAENYLYKLWVRGELCFDETRKDKYELGRSGSGDFWTSHIHRQTFTNCGDVARQLIRFQYPLELKGKPRLLDGVEDKANNKFGVRTLAKRLRQLWATVEYSLIDPSDTERLIAEMAKGLTLANGKHIYT